MTRVIVVCAWCKAIMRFGLQPASHGICKQCKARLEQEAGLR